MYANVYATLAYTCMHNSDVSVYSQRLLRIWNLWFHHNCICFLLLLHGYVKILLWFPDTKLYLNSSIDISQKWLEFRTFIPRWCTVYFCWITLNKSLAKVMLSLPNLINFTHSFSSKCALKFHQLFEMGVLMFWRRAIFVIALLTLNTADTVALKALEERVETTPSMSSSTSLKNMGRGHFRGRAMITPETPQHIG